ncbi:endospore germination permease [Cohnella suwonensis]|uniref:Endospore germination permease n=1 Tax=Cohnella suwonensis TaxID=696072 RepID=A0ABW0LXB6_9BACL
MNQSMITTRQATLWLTMYYIGSAVLIVPVMLASAAKQDAWMSAILALGLHFAIIPVFATLGHLSGSEGAGAFLSRLFGRWGGKLTLFVLLLTGPFPILIFNLRDLSDFTTTVVMQRTPMEAISYMMLFAVVIGLYSGVRTVGRAAEALFPFVFFLIIVLLISITPSLSFWRLFPFMENGIRPVISASIPLFGYPFMEVSVLWLICSRMKQPGQFGQVLRRSAWMSGTVFLLLTVFVIMVAGAPITAQLSFPSYFISRTISIGDFYERIEAIVTMIWYMTMFFRMALLLYVSSEGTAALLSLKDGRPLHIPLALIALPLSLHAWPNPASIMEYDRNWPFFRLAFGVLLPLLILWAAVAKRKTGTRSTAR